MGLGSREALRVRAVDVTSALRWEEERGRRKTARSYTYTCGIILGEDSGGKGTRKGRRKEEERKRRGGDGSGTRMDIVDSGASEALDSGKCERSGDGGVQRGTNYGLRETVARQ